MNMEEQERAAYLAGNIVQASLLGSLIDAEEREAELTAELEDDTQTEELEALRQFFNDCFERLAGHYPCPSVFSDYDKSVIFKAIEQGEAND